MIARHRSPTTSSPGVGRAAGHAARAMPQLRQPPPEPRAGEVRVCAPRPWPPRTSTWSKLQSRRLVCAARPARCSSAASKSGLSPRAAATSSSCPTSASPTPQWESLLIPISLAFFFHSTPAERVRGRISQSGRGHRIALGIWKPGRRWSTRTPCWPRCNPTSRPCWSIAWAAQRSYYRVPIDECYKLVGLIRVHWRGLSGGMRSVGRGGQVLRPLEGEIPAVIDLNFQVAASRAAGPCGRAAIGRSSCGSASRPRRSPRPFNPILLRCQIRIEPARRQYQAGSPRRTCATSSVAPERWGKTMRSMLWTNTQAIVPAFSGSTVVDLPVPCTYDFNVAATKYFAALDDGEVPLCLLFSGTVFYQAEGGPLQVCPISWEKQADFRLAVAVWRDMMDQLLPQYRLAEPGPQRVPTPGGLSTRHGLAHLAASLRQSPHARTGAGTGPIMNRALIDNVVQAVLYEGYNLYPYRPSVKSRQPLDLRRPVSAPLQRGPGRRRRLADADAMPGRRAIATTRSAVQARFLQLAERRVGRLAEPLEACRPTGRRAGRRSSRCSVGATLLSNLARGASSGRWPFETSLAELIDRGRTAAFVPIRPATRVGAVARAGRRDRGPDRPPAGTRSRARLSWRPSRWRTGYSG